MKQLKTEDPDWIIMEMENQSPMFETFIHIPSGELVNECCDDFDMEEIEKNEDDYIFIDPYPSSEGYKVMDKFVRHEVEDKAIQKKLDGELSKNRPFSRFKEALYEYPDIQKKFFAYKDEKMMEYLIDWLKGYDLELVIVPRVINIE